MYVLYGFLDGSTDTDYDDSYHTSYYDVLPNSLKNSGWDAIEKRPGTGWFIGHGDGTEQDEDGNVQY
jgi:hypothetical protein